MQKLLPKDIQSLKGKRKITKVTALDYFSDRAIEIGEEQFDLFKDALSGLISRKNKQK